MNRLLVKVASTAAAGGLLVLNAVVAQIPPPQTRAEHVEITKSPELESAHDDTAIVRWTTTNPRGNDEHFGIVHYGTEVITNSDRTISALLGASPGASVSVNIVLDVIKLCFPQLLATDAGKARMKEMIPIDDEDIKLPENADRFRAVQQKANELLQLA